MHMQEGKISTNLPGMFCAFFSPPASNISIPLPAFCFKVTVFAGASLHPAQAVL